MDPLQLPKLQKKVETDEQLRALEEVIRREEEDRVREEEEKLRWNHQAPEWNQEAQWEDQGWHQESRQEVPQSILHELWPKSEPPQDRPVDPLIPQSHQSIRTEILNLLHKSPESGQYEHSQQLANQLSATNKSVVHNPRDFAGQAPTWQPSMNYNRRNRSSEQSYGGYSKNWRSQAWFSLSLFILGPYYHYYLGPFGEDV